MGTSCTCWRRRDPKWTMWTVDSGQSDKLLTTVHCTSIPRHFRPKSRLCLLVDLGRAFFAGENVSQRRLQFDRRSLKGAPQIGFAVRQAEDYGVGPGLVADELHASAVGVSECGQLLVLFFDE